MEEFHKKYAAKIAHYIKVSSNYVKLAKVRDDLIEMLREILGDLKDSVAAKPNSMEKIAKKLKITSNHPSKLDFQFDNVIAARNTIDKLNTELSELKKRYQNEIVDWEVKLTSLQRKYEACRDNKEVTNSAREKFYSMLNATVDKSWENRQKLNFDEDMEILRAPPRKVAGDLKPGVNDIISYIFRAQTSMTNEKTVRGIKILLEMIKYFQFSNLQTLLDTESEIVLVPNLIFTQGVSGLMALYSNVYRYGQELPNMLYDVAINDASITDVLNFNPSQFNAKRFASLSFFDKDAKKSLEKALVLTKK